MSASPNFITCQRCKGLGDVVVAWDEAEHGPRKSEWDDATEGCPDCGGEGVIDQHDAKAIIAGIAGITEEDLSNGL